MKGQSLIRSMSFLSSFVWVYGISGTLSASVISGVDSFDSGTPADNGYYTSADNSALSVSGGGVRLTSSNDSAVRDGFFKSFSSTTLQNGQTLKLSGTIVGLGNLNSGGNNQIEFILANAGPNSFSSDVARDAWSTSSSAPLQIYNVSLPTVLSSGTASFYAFNYAMDSSAKSLTVQSATDGATLGTTTISGLSSGDGQNLGFEFSVTRVDDQTFVISFTLGGVSVFSNVDTGSYDFSTFNTLAFGVAKGVTGRYLALDDLEVQVIPELPTATLLFISAAMIVILWGGRCTLSFCLK